MVSWATPPGWFTRELRLIDPSLTVKWNNKIKRWCIYHADGSLSKIVEHPKTKAFRDLDQRILRKLRIDIFFTHNDKALALWNSDQREEKEVNAELRQYMTRGLDGISDYLSGWDKE